MALAMGRLLLDLRRADPNPDGDLDRTQPSRPPLPLPLRFRTGEEERGDLVPVGDVLLLLLPLPLLLCERLRGLPPRTLPSHSPVSSGVASSSAPHSSS